METSSLIPPWWLTVDTSSFMVINSDNFFHSFMVVNSGYVFFRGG